MAYFKRTFEGNGVKTETKYHSYRCGGKNKRAPNYKPTTDKQQKINERRSIRHLAELINTNFNENDIRVDLTYSGEEPKPEEAEKRLDQFLKCARTFWKKLGLLFKWILVTEYQAESAHAGKEGQHVRIHHHLLVNSGGEKVKFSDIKKLWPYAKLKFNTMRYFDGTWEAAQAIANYFTKETSKTMKKPGTIQKARYRRSRNLTPPNVKVETIHSRTWAKAPRPPRGYIIQGIEEGFTEEGYPFRYIVMVKTEETPQQNRASYSNTQHWKQGNARQKKLKKTSEKAGENEQTQAAIFPHISNRQFSKPQT